MSGDEFYDDDVTSGPVVDEVRYAEREQERIARQFMTPLERALAFVADHEQHWIFAFPDQPSIGCNNCCRVLGPGDLR